MSIIVDVAAAVICFASSCYPALVGKDTPRGEFKITHYATRQRGYGGDILSFKETERDLYTIHRVIHVPGQNRHARLKDSNPQNRLITNGCINVDPVVYKKLVDCCSRSTVIIK
jgi:hypothetical protein